MMKENKNNRNKWLHLRLTEEEYKQLQYQFSKTTERKISAYSRNILMGKPMIKGVRNLTAEALMQEFAQLRKDLNGIANNYNQAVHQLHLIRKKEQYKPWLETYETGRRKLLHDVERIKDFINKAASLWLQS